MQTFTRLLLLLLLAQVTKAQPIKVTVEKNESGYYLTRGGEPYYIRGAGGQEHIDELLFLGGNSIRTWSPDDADEVLELAQKNNLTVMMGLWVQHERHGFDYDDTAAVRKQLEYFTEVVRKYKDHPSILLWGIGNEVDLFYSNTKVWDAIQDIAAMIHREDPNHPTSTVTAGLDSTEAHLIKTRAPDIDIYGINTYGDIHKVPGDIRRFGWTGPYIISEWGPTGHWEVDKTSWGAPIEQTSTEKAFVYKTRFEKYIAADSAQCIGSYVFLWGQKQETTATWYGLFTEKGHPTEPLDELFVAWRNAEPPHRAPTISWFSLDSLQMRDNIKLKAEDRYKIQLKYKDPDGDRVKVTYAVYPESFSQSAGGDFENALQPVLGSIRKKRKNSATLVAPKEEGAYRLFVFVKDKNNRVAYANIPFYVEPRKDSDPAPNPVQFKKQTLQVSR